MALKADRYELQTDISFFWGGAAAATRGGCVVHDSTAGSGSAMDQGANKVIYKGTAVATDSPVGILMNDVVNKDLTRTHLNQHKDEVQLGGKVTLLRKGYVVTNSIESNTTPSAGEVAYVHDDGTISNGANIKVATAIASGNLAIGRFVSAKDEDGYAKVEVNLPNHGWM
jgi:hypothetical protein